MLRILSLTAALGALLSVGSPAAAASTDIDCTLIVEGTTGRTLMQDGFCDRRYSPASTFKVPLALIGYDTGVLVDEHSPAWDYKPEFDAPKREQMTVDPTIWERESIIWYSREIVRRVGAKSFGRYVADFDYGNADVTGTPGRNDGLTRSWVDSSLMISPLEQVAFLRRLLVHDLPVSEKSFGMTKAILPTFKAGAWTVTGKTGSARVRAEGQGRWLGWFVGWADKDGRRIVFARLSVNAKQDNPKGPTVRAAFLKNLPSLVP